MNDPNAPRAADTPPPACSTCRFFRDDECRKNAPRLVTDGPDGLWFTAFGFMSGGTKSGWPSVDDDDWCGEHQPSNAGVEGRKPAQKGEA